MGGRGSSSNVPNKSTFNVSSYKKTKTKLENTISEINNRIRLFDSNPTPNGLRMASQLEKQKEGWQNQLDNLEAEYTKYKNSKKRK